MTYLHRLSKRIASLRPALIGCAVLLVSCSKGEKVEFLGPNPNANSAPQSLRVDPPVVSVPSGQDLQLTAVAFSASGQPVATPIDWSSTGGEVSPTGVFTGHEVGTFTVRAKVHANPSLIDSAQVTVWYDDSQLLSLLVFPDSSVITAGDSIQVAAALLMASGEITFQAAVDWTADAGTVSESGWFTPPGPGSFVVTGTSPLGLHDAARILVQPRQVRLQSLAISPSPVSVVPGQQVSFLAASHWSDGSATPADIVWSATGGTIDANGNYVAGSSGGQYVVVARDRRVEVADTALVTINPPTISLLSITPGLLNIKTGANQQFSVLAQMSDGSWRSVPVTWQATGGSVAANGVFTAPALPGTFKVIATATGVGVADTATVVVTQPLATLNAIRVNPSSATVPQGASRQFSALADWSDGTQTAATIQWSATGGTIDAAGLYVAGQVAGNFIVIGRHASGPADTSDVTVTAPVLVSLSLTPPTASVVTSQTVQLTVSGVWSDGGTTAPAVTWSAAGGTVTPSGLFTAGTVPGTYAVIATHQGGTLADTSLVTVTAPPRSLTTLTLSPGSVILGPTDSKQFSVFGTWSDGGTDAPAVVYSATGGTITASGLYTAGPVPGSYQVIAVHAGGKADTSAVQIKATVTLTSMTVGPDPVSLLPGGVQQFSISAIWSNGSTTVPPVTWTATGGTITSSGRYTAGGVTGSFRVIAAQQGGPIRDTVDVTILSLPAPTLSSLSVSPNPTSVQAGSNTQFTLAAVWSDGSTTVPSVTWSATGGTINSTGRFTAGSTAGTAFRVIARHLGGTKADTAAVTVTSAPPPPPSLTSLTLTPSPVSMAIGTTQQFSVAAAWSDGSTTVPAITWTATGGTVSSTGLYTAGILPGSSYRVIARDPLSGKADTAAVTLTTISVPTLLSITVAPGSLNMLSGTSQAFTATGQFSDGSTGATLVTWSATGGTITSGGVFTAGATAGSAQVKATMVGGLINGTANITVSVPSASGCSAGPNQPNGFFTIVGRHFNSLGTGTNGRGTGPLPCQTTGSEGFDDVEYRYSNTTLAVDPTAPISQSGILRFLYQPGGPITGTYNPGVVQTMSFTGNTYGQRQYRKLYLRTAFRVSANWQGHPTSTNKLMFIRATQGSVSRPEPIIRLRGAGSGNLELNVDLQGSPRDKRNIGAQSSLAPNKGVAAANNVTRGQWHILEAVLEMGINGQANGRLRLFLDGVLTHDYTDIEYEGSPSETAFWDVLHVAPTWGGGGGTINQLMWLDYDDFFVSGAP